MLAPALRALLEQARGAGTLRGDAVSTGRAEHPVCGDSVEVDVRVGDGVIAEIAWRASACPATTAVAALAAMVLPGRSVADVAAVLRDGIQRHGGLQAHERHAEALLVRALTSALAGAS